MKYYVGAVTPTHLCVIVGEIRGCQPPTHLITVPLHGEGNAIRSKSWTIMLRYNNDLTMFTISVGLGLTFNAGGSPLCYYYIGTLWTNDTDRVGTGWTCTNQWKVHTTDTRTVEGKQELVCKVIQLSKIHTVSKELWCPVTSQSSWHHIPYHTFHFLLWIIAATATTIHKGVIHVYVTLLSTRSVKCML